MGEQDKYESRPPDNGGGGDRTADEQSQNTVAADQATPDLQDIDALKKDRDSLYDRLLRKQAEFENYKKRIDREKSEFMQFAAADLMKELLNALDSFDLAIRSAAAEGAGAE